MGCGASAPAVPKDPRIDADGKRIGYQDPRTSRYHLERKRGYLTQDPNSLEDYRELLRKNGVDTEEPEDTPDNITVVSNNSTTGSPLGLRPSIRSSSLRSLFSPDSGIALKSARPAFNELEFNTSTDIMSIRFAGEESPKVDSFYKKPHYQSPPPCQENFNGSTTADQSPEANPHSASWSLPNHRVPPSGSNSSSSGNTSPEPEGQFPRKNVSFAELEKEPTRSPPPRRG